MNNSKHVGLFLGTMRGYEVLKALINKKKDISGVLILTQQKHEYENATELIATLCKKHNISYKYSSEVKPKNYENYLREVKADVVFVISWRFLISKDCFSIPSHGVFILHDSLLPNYRGASPTNWIIINGEKETGLSLQYISEEMDAGDLVDQIKIPIDPEETAKTLNDKYLKLYPEIILKNVDLILENKNKRVPQDSRKATFSCRRAPEDGRIDFTKSADVIVRLIRGITYPYPGAFCYFKDKKIIIWEASILKNPPTYKGRIPGKIVNIQEDYIDVLTIDGMIRIFSISDSEKDELAFIKPKTLLNSISHPLH